MYEENTNQLIDYQYESRKRIQNSRLVDSIAERIQSSDDYLDSVLGFSLPPDRLRYNEGCCQTAETREYYDDFGDDLESHFNNDRSTFKRDPEEKGGHAENPQIITLTLF